MPIAMHDVMMQLTLGIISQTMFKTELGEDKEELAAAVDVTIKQSAKTIFAIILPLAVPTPAMWRISGPFGRWR